MSVCNLSNDTGIPEDTGTWGENHLESDNPYRIIGEQLFSFISYDELASIYSDIGRPSINPVILSLVTVFQFLEDVPDRVAALWVKIRLDWKYALHLPLHDTGFHYSDLCNFRKRLAENGKESLIFEHLLEKIKSLGFLKKRKHQRTDSTHVLAKIRRLSRLENLSEGLRVALRAIYKADRTFYETRIPVLYTEHWSKPLSDYQMTDEERRQGLQRVGQDIHWLLSFLKTNKESFLRLPQLEVLQTLFSQHFTIQSQKVSLKKEATAGKERIQTPHDPEARYSKKRGKSWTGGKVHITETANEKGEVNFITDITTTKACERDSETLSQIQGNLEKRKLKPEQQFVDKAYITGDNLADSQENDIRLMGEASELDNKGLYTADEFSIDYDSQTVTCPANVTSWAWHEIETGKHKGDIQISFGQQCQDCSLKDKCTKSKRGRILRLHGHYQLLKERREECKAESFKEAMKRRPPIEGTISEMVRSHGLRRNRYRGLAKNHLQNLMIGTAVNLKRLVKAMSMSKNSQKQQLATV